MKNFMTEEHFDELKAFMTYVCKPDAYEIYAEFAATCDPLDLYEKKRVKFDSKILNEAISQILNEAWRGEVSKEKAAMERKVVQKYTDKITELEKKLKELEIKKGELKTENDRLKTTTIWLDSLQWYKDRVLPKVEEGGDKDE